ncbi:amino acid ABC transporter permease [Azospirillum picis]|uniref:Polar amino acid transport system permease protein n=1 Tax=Azospirillum picis TaxID=488438 RepID=A0ABU0MCY4_9PROT|nr:amino acid ABC transporter permease [Azospirillum picis]MBP2297734.1 polar amino acid transport system permease protein [Azospirillum picis]MDQ0531243.1 polar amino acid transport system permease protein [Azospirillum picis]
MRFDFDYFLSLLFSTRFFEPVAIVIAVSATAMVIGVVVGTIGGIVSNSPLPLLQRLVRLYVTTIRGVPVLVQIVFWYNGLPALTGGAVNLSAYAAGIIALGINEGAYMTEIVRSGIQSVDRGQREASQALSLSYRSMMMKVILPQAVRIAIPPTGNQVVNLIKNTSLLFTVAIPEIFATGTNIFSANFKYFEVIAVVAIWYLLLAVGYGFLQRTLERRFAKGRRTLYDLAAA